MTAPHHHPLSQSAYDSLSPEGKTKNFNIKIEQTTQQAETKLILLQHYGNKYKDLNVGGGLKEN
jgi:hypothetical protein